MKKALKAGETASEQIAAEVRGVWPHDGPGLTRESLRHEITPGDFTFTLALRSVCRTVSVHLVATCDAAVLLRIRRLSNERDCNEDSQSDEPEYEEPSASGQRYHQQRGLRPIRPVYTRGRATCCQAPSMTLLDSSLPFAPAGCPLGPIFGTRNVLR